MSKLQWFSLGQLKQTQQMPLVKCAGVINQVLRKPTYFSFTITDNASQIEATIYQDEKQYSYLNLPNLHDCVIVVGNSYRKQSANKSFITKVKVKLFRIINQNQLLQISQSISESQKMREDKNVVQSVATKTKRSVLNELKGTIIPIQIRSLILGCVYMTLENNLDLNSYTFSWYTIQKHRLTKSYIESKKLKEEAVDYLREFIDAQLKYLSENKQIQEKEKIEGQTLYVVYRTTFVRLEMRILGIINEKKKTGTILNDLVSILNKQEGFVEQKNFIINENLVQKILKKFIQESRIYKTSQKVLYPNS